MVPLKLVNSKVLIGSHIYNDLSDTKLLTISKTEFNCGQSLWYAGFGGWNSENNFDFSKTNATVNWLMNNDLSPHVHMLVGPDFYMPTWLKNGTWSTNKLDSLLESLVNGIMETNNNKEKVDIWNIANELINDDGTYRTDMVWNQIGWEDDVSGLTGSDKINNIHPVFIRKAFEYARNRTSKKLEYRDYNIESDNPSYGWDKKHKGVFQLLKHMKQSNIPVDVIGIQGHYSIGNVNWVLENNGLKNIIQKFKALGLEVNITEMDLGAENLPWTTTLADTQKDNYYSYIKQAIEGGASRIYTWGVQDGKDTSWRTNEHPLPWNENLNKKPAYNGIYNALNDTK